MNMKRNEYRVSTEQAAYLRQLASEQPAFGDLLKRFGLEQIDGDTLTIYPQEAEALREYFTERLAKVGFDAEYKPNSEGVFLERFIDDLFAPASQD
jgi:hypothetical protein